MNDEFHRRVIVIQQQNLVHGRLFGLGPRFKQKAGLFALFPLMIRPLITGIIRIAKAGPVIIAVIRPDHPHNIVFIAVFTTRHGINISKNHAVPTAVIRTPIYFGIQTLKIQQFIA